MSLFKAASTVSLLTLVSRITGLVRELLIASTFGASAMTDAFNVAFRIPNFFRRLFGEGAFSQAFVPVLAATRAQQGQENTHLLVDRVATVLAWALLLALFGWGANLRDLLEHHTNRAWGICKVARPKHTKAAHLARPLGVAR